LRIPFKWIVENAERKAVRTLCGPWTENTLPVGGEREGTFPSVPIRSRCAGDTDSVLKPAQNDTLAIRSRYTLGAPAAFNPSRLLCSFVASAAIQSSRRRCG
jgi:hypothetical protein